MSLRDQRQAFKDRLKSQPVIVKQERPAPSGPSKSLSDQQKNDLEALHTKKKRILESTKGVQVAGAGRHLMSAVYNILTLLKDVDVPLTMEEIKKNLNVDIMNNPDLFNNLRYNDKITFDEKDRTFAYKPTYLIKNKHDLLELLQKNKPLSGMDIKDLRESCKIISELAEELLKEGKAMAIRNKDQSLRVLFYNDPSLNVAIDDSFKEMWDKLRVPDETDLPKELEKAGLKTMEVMEEKHTSGQNSLKSKTRKRANRRIKLTNTHLDIDLTADFDPKKK